MKAEFNGFGQLIITPENWTEQIALKAWNEDRINPELYREHGNCFVDFFKEPTVNKVPVDDAQQ